MALAAADGPGSLTLRALPLGDRGVVPGIQAGAWKVKVAGKDAPVVGMRTPEQMGQARQKWAFVLMPLRDPEARRLALQAVATFMTTLPATDSVLLVMRTSDGLVPLTPGFTTRPSLWAAALDRASKELPGRLKGSPDPAFTLPPTPASEPEEGMQPVQGFLARVGSMDLQRSTDDSMNARRSLTEVYAVEDMASQTKTVAAAVAGLEKLADALAKEPGEKHLVLFSRNEVDDLSNPFWGQRVSKMPAGGLRGGSSIMPGRDVQNTRLTTEMMIRDVSLAIRAFNARIAADGLTLHAVGGTGEGFGGAYAEVATASGGFRYNLTPDLPARMGQLLPLWAATYELKVDLPAGVARPADVSVEAPAKGVKLFAPTRR